MQPEFLGELKQAGNETTKIEKGVYIMALTKGAVNDIQLGKGGSYSSSRDVLKHQLWDTRTFGETISSFTFFSQPYGSPWKTIFSKTTNETNLADAGKLPNGQTFLIKRMGIGLICPLEATATNGSDLAQAFINLIQSSYFEIKLAGREFDYQVHGRQFLPAIAINAENASNFFSMRVGDFVASGWVSLDNTPIFVDQLVNFNVVHHLANPDTAIDAILDANSSLLKGAYGTMQITLEGTLTRAK